MKRSRLIQFVHVILTLIWLSSCRFNQATSIPDLSSAYSITIISNWSGLAPAAPINASYILEIPNEHPENGPFQGSAQFSVGGYFSEAKQETASINVPKDIMRSFLEKLSQASPENGDYEPLVEHTDDYPDISIRILYGNAEAIEFYTASQGEEHIPWKVTFDGKDYILNSGVPAQALEELRPYLAQDVLTKLIEQVEQQAEQ